MICQMAFRGLRKPCSTVNPPLLEQFNVFKQQKGNFSVSLLKYNHPDEFRPQRGAIKKKYLRRYPLIRTQEDGTVTVEGVSNKALPCPVTWLHPGEAERFRPGENASGDLGNVKSLVDEKYISPSQPKLEYQISKYLMNATPEVKRVLSLEFGRKKDLVNKVRYEVVRRVQEHPLDFSSLPVVIATMTVEIRNHQSDMIELYERPTGRKRNQMRRRDLDILISHRRKCLELLRERDYKKFEWLLETLNIVYKPSPAKHDSWEKVERRKHQDRLTDLWCDELRTFKLEKLRKEFEAKQPDFLRRKANLLKDILKEEINSGEPHTVNESEIENLLQKADSIEARLKESQTSEKEYHVYEEKVVTDTEYIVGDS